MDASAKGYMNPMTFGGALRAITGRHDMMYEPRDDMLSCSHARPCFQSPARSLVMTCTFFSVYFYFHS